MSTQREVFPLSHVYCTCKIFFPKTPDGFLQHPLGPRIVTLTTRTTQSLCSHALAIKYQCCFRQETRHLDRSTRHHLDNQVSFVGALCFMVSLKGYTHLLKSSPTVWSGSGTTCMVLVTRSNRKFSGRRDVIKYLPIVTRHL